VIGCAFGKTAAASEAQRPAGPRRMQDRGVAISWALASVSSGAARSG
jgi:hypothetical protein